MTSRRDFIKQSSLLSAGLFVDKSEWFKKGKTLGLQLYTVRSEVSKEKLPGTLKTIAEAGYNQLELYGYNNRSFFGYSVKEMAAMLKQNGLKTPSGHYGLNDMLYGENYNWESWKNLVEDSKMLGHKYIVVPYLDDKHRSTDYFKKLADTLNKAGEISKKAGMCAGYHNHDFEFKEENGTTGWEILLKETDPKLVALEMDIYWVRHAGHDPIDWFNRYPGRFPLWHIKDLALTPKKRSTIVGTGTIDFKALYEKRKLAGAEYLYVEQEEYTKPVFDCIRESYDFVTKNVLS